MMITRIIFILCLTMGRAPDLANAAVPAVLQTYTTWGDFSIIVNTFERLALLMSDNSYQGLFAGFIVMAIVFGVIGVLGKALFSGKTSATGWLTCATTVIMGVIVYTTFIKPTTQITIYDEVFNQQKTVGGVPEGIVLVAGLANLFETGSIELIWTSSNPDSYKSNAGGTVFNILHKAFQGDIDLSGNANGGRYTNKSIQKYIEDCLIYELSKPGSTLDLNDIYKNTNFIPHFAKASNPAKSTIWYDDSNKAGATVTCEASWTNLNTYFTTLTENSPPVVKYWEERCQRAGYSDVPGAAGRPVMEECRDKATNFVGNTLLSSSVTSSQLMIQHLLASELFNIIKDTDAGALANRNAGNAMSGMATMGNQWIPVIKGVVVAIFLSMFPFACLLVPTPLFRQSLCFMLGAFVFLVSWGICDAIIHSFAMDKAIALFKEISNGELGLKSMMNFESDSAKALAAFGAARWSSMMIASIVAGMLVRFGGSGMSHLANQLAFKQSGAEAGETLLNPNKRAAALEQTREAMPSQTVSSSYKYGEFQAAGLFSKTQATETNLGAANKLAGGNPVAAGERVAGGNVMRMRENASHAEKINAFASEHKMSADAVTGSIAKYQVASSGGKGLALEGLAKNLGVSENEAMGFMEDVGIKGAYGQAQGKSIAYDKAKAGGFKGSMPEYFAMHAELDSSRGFNEAAGYQRAANKHYGGDTNAMHAERYSYQTMKSAGYISQLSDQATSDNISFDDMSGAIGQAEASSSAARSRVIKNSGFDALYRQDATQMYKGLSSAVYTNALNDIGEHGKISEPTQDTIRRISEDPIGRAALHSAGQIPVTVSPDKAENFGRFLDVDPENISGSAIQMSLMPDRNGNIQSSYASAQSGFVGNEGHIMTITDTSKGYLERSTESPGGHQISSSVEVGPGMTPNTMLNAILTKSPMLGQQINSAPNDANREQIEIMQATKVADALNNIKQHSGVITDSSNIEGSTSAKIGTPLGQILGLSASASTTASLSRANRSQENYNLNYDHVRDIQADAREEATSDGGFNKAAFSTLYADKLYDFVKEADSNVVAKDTSDFGASAGPKEAAQFINNKFEPFRDKSPGERIFEE